MRLIKGVKIKNISSDGKYLKYLFKSERCWLRWEKKQELDELLVSESPLCFFSPILFEKS